MRERGEMLTFEEDDVRVAWVHALLHGYPPSIGEVSPHFPPICFSFLFFFCCWAENGERIREDEGVGPFLDLVRIYEAQDEDFRPIGPL